jgi:competence protein ComEA
MKALRRLALSCVAAALAVAVGVGPAVAAAKAKAMPTGKININSATVTELSSLPGVGPRLAARIVEYRQKAGGFKTTQELLNVRGVGEKNFSKLQPHLTAGEKPATGGSR